MTRETEQTPGLTVPELYEVVVRQGAELGELDRRLAQAEAERDRLREALRQALNLGIEFADGGLNEEAFRREVGHLVGHLAEDKQT